jgi:hypothetical protein
MVSVEFPSGSQENRDLVAESGTINPEGNYIYIAGDDGEYYRITQEELKESHRIDPDDPNIETLDFLTGHGVAHAGIRRDAADQLHRNPRFAQSGMWVMLMESIHFLNLANTSNYPPRPKRKRPKARY